MAKIKSNLFITHLNAIDWLHHETPHESDVSHETKRMDESVKFGLL